MFAEAHQVPTEVVSQVQEVISMYMSVKDQQTRRRLLLGLMSVTGIATTYNAILNTSIRLTTKEEAEYVKKATDPVFVKEVEDLLFGYLCAIHYSQQSDLKDMPTVGGEQ